MYFKIQYSLVVVVVVSVVVGGFVVGFVVVVAFVVVGSVVVVLGSVVGSVVAVDIDLVDEHCWLSLYRVVRYRATKIHKVFIVTKDAKEI